MQECTVIDYLVIRPWHLTFCRFATPFASRDYRQQHMPVQRPGVIGMPPPQPGSAGAPGFTAPAANPVLFNAVPPSQAGSNQQQATLFYGGFGGFYSGAYPQAAGQQDWWSK